LAHDARPPLRPAARWPVTLSGYAREPTVGGDLALLFIPTPFVVLAACSAPATATRRLTRMRRTPAQRGNATVTPGR